jgi:AcrR family transcriptional regulator
MNHALQRTSPVPVPTSHRAGRPRGSSRAMLQEAAAELFLEQTYASTTIEQITRRAGVSRNTFFNYFAAKSDLLWVEVDTWLVGLPHALETALAAAPGETGPPAQPTDAIRAALLALAAGIPAGDVPWALTQTELMGTTVELQASALSRFTAHQAVLTRAVERASARQEGDLLAQAFAVAALAATSAAALAWAGAGVGRGSLVPFLDAALTPVCDGFGPLLPAG